MAEVLGVVLNVVVLVLMYRVLAAYVRPTRQPVFSRVAGILLICGLTLIVGGFVTALLSVIWLGNVLCNAAIAVHVWRECLWLRFRIQRTHKVVEDEKAGKGVPWKK